MAPKTAQPCRIDPAMRPNMKTQATGISISASSSRKPVKLLGLSNGTAELEL